jgi:hypothetical protein
MIVMTCDRCGLKSLSASLDDLALDLGWVERNLPARGSLGARSNTKWHLCPKCDDLLYDWMYPPRAPEGTGSDR